MLESDDAREMLLGTLDVGAITFDVVRFNMDTGDIRGGDVDNGVPGNDGDTLLLRDIGGLEDHNLEDELSLEQAGIFASRSALRLSETPFERITNRGARPIGRNLCTQDSYLGLLESNR